MVGFFSSFSFTKFCKIFDIYLMFFRLHDIFRNTSLTGNTDNLELACDGVILDMDYNPTQ